MSEPLPPFPTAALLKACEEFEGWLAECSQFCRDHSSEERVVLVTPGINAVQRRVANASFFALTQATFVVQPVLQWYRRLKRVLAEVPKGVLDVGHVERSFWSLGLGAPEVIEALAFGCVVLEESLRLAQLAHAPLAARPNE